MDSLQRKVWYVQRLVFSPRRTLRIQPTNYYSRTNNCLRNSPLQDGAERHSRQTPPLDWLITTCNSFWLRQTSADEEGGIALRVKWLMMRCGGWWWIGRPAGHQLHLSEASASQYTKSAGWWWSGRRGAEISRIQLSINLSFQRGCCGRLPYVWA